MGEKDDILWETDRVLKKYEDLDKWRKGVFGDISNSRISETFTTNNSNISIMAKKKTPPTVEELTEALNLYKTKELTDIQNIISSILKTRADELSARIENDSNELKLINGGQSVG